MDILDRLLGHDQWATAYLLRRCRELTDEQLDRQLGIDYGNVRATLAHMISNVEVWTDLIAERPVDLAERDVSLQGLIARHERSYETFAAIARGVRDEGRLNDTFIDILDDPPAAKTFGGAIAHVLVHDCTHRAHVFAMLEELGVPDLTEGDLLSWEIHHV